MRMYNNVSLYKWPKMGKSRFLGWEEKEDGLVALFILTDCRPLFFTRVWFCMRPAPIIIIYGLLFVSTINLSFFKYFSSDNRENIVLFPFNF